MIDDWLPCDLLRPPHGAIIQLARRHGARVRVTLPFVCGLGVAWERWHGWRYA